MSRTNPYPVGSRSITSAPVITKYLESFPAYLRSSFREVNMGMTGCWVLCSARNPGLSPRGQYTFDVAKTCWKSSPPIAPVVKARTASAREGGDGSG